MTWHQHLTGVIVLFVLSALLMWPRMESTPLRAHIQNGIALLLAATGFVWLWLVKPVGVLPWLTYVLIGCLSMSTLAASAYLATDVIRRRVKAKPNAVP